MDRDTILQAASNASAAALEFLRVFARRAHWVDDLIDQDNQDLGPGGMPSVSKAAEMEAEWLLCLTSNPFFLAHRAQLVPAMVLALNAWVDSEKMRGEKGEGRAADVVKGQWHEVVWLVAWLTGGWDSLRKASSQFRRYDFETKPEPVSNEAAITGILKAAVLCVRCGRGNDRAPLATCSRCGAEWASSFQSSKPTVTKELNGLPR